ncbi:MAG TPA: hypothetical protein VGJ87_01125, partial [Roseiflexaceae bacterium]
LNYTPQIKQGVFFGSCAEPFAERLRTQSPLDTEPISLYSKRRSKTRGSARFKMSDHRFMTTTTTTTSMMTIEAIGRGRAPGQ